MQILLAPAKFALSFTLGSLFFMAGFAVLEGPVSHFKRTCTLARLPFTLAYVTSMGALPHACVRARWRALLMPARAPQS